MPSSKSNRKDVLKGSSKPKKPLGNGSDVFFNKLKDTIYEPLPDPKAHHFFSFKNITHFLFMVLVIGAAVIVVNYVFFDNRSGDGQAADDAQGVDGATQEPDSHGGTQSEYLSIKLVSGQSVFGMGRPIAITYEIKDVLGDVVEDISQYKAMLYLTDNREIPLAFIGEHPRSYGENTIGWDPGVITIHDDTIGAPQPGQYRIALILQREDDQPSRALYKAHTSTFRLQYDTLDAKEFPFSCYHISGYLGQDWYAGFIRALEENSIDKDDINGLCYSKQGGVAILVIPGAGANGYPYIARYRADKEQLDVAVYLDRRDISPTESAKVTQVERDTTNKTATFGRRDGSTIPVLLGGVRVFMYDYIENSFADAR